MSERERDDHTGVETTGHEWDGIKELDTPLPRWWLWVFYLTIVWAIGYWVVMPAWPGITGYTRGLRGHSDRVNVSRELADL
jgi:cytochrome c oxidase cbb3-type subunit III